MRKHFLILMLMTLLPLAGWAAVPIIDNEYDVNVVPSDGSAVWCGGKPTVQAGWVIVQSETAQKPTKAQVAEQIEIRDLANYNVGNHTYALQLKAGADGYVDIATSEENHYNRYYLHTNAQNTATLTITKYTGDPIIDASLLGYVNDELTYNTFEQALLSGGATATANSVDVPVIYTLNPSGNPLVTFDSYANVKGTNAGEYTVYFKVAETDDYAGTDWIPMAGHKDIAQATQDFTAEGAVPTANTWIYDAQPHALAIAPTAAVQYGTYEYCATNSTNDADWTTDLSGFKATSNNDTKTVWWRVKVEGGNYEGHDATQLTATITKATPEFTTLPTFAEDFPYDGQTHQLITDPGVAEFNATPSFALRYKRVGSNTWSEWSSWSENYELRTAKNAAVYEIAYCTKTTADLNKPESIYKTITVSQIDIPAESFTAPVAKTDLIYDGTDQELITEASWVGDAYGDFLYSLNGTDWTADVPVGTAHGDYTVYFKIDPVKYYSTFSNYNVYVAPQAITATIAQATITTFTEPVAKTGLKADGGTYELVEAASWGGNPELGTFSYSLDGENWSVDVPQSSEAGDYTVYFKMTPTDATNYSEFTNSYAVTIADYKPILIIPDGKSKAYGSNDPALTYTIQDLDGHTLDLALQGVTLARTQGEAAGEYTIYVKEYEPAAADAEYTVLNVLGNPTSTAEYNKTAVFTIQATGNLVLKFTDDAVAYKSSKIYDATASLTDLAFDNDDLEVVSGLLGTDDWTALKGSANITFALKTTQGGTPSGKVNVGDYQVVATYSDGLVNYASVTIEPLDFTVTERPLKINVENQEVAYGANISKVYGTNWSLSTGSWYGLATGDDITDTGIELYTVKEDINEYVPGSVNENAIQARIPATTTSNYKINETGNTWGTLTITDVIPTTVLAMRSSYEDDADDEFTTIQAYNGKTVTVEITVNRTQTVNNSTLEYTWKGEDWNAFILPFAITPKELSEAFGYAIVNVVNPEKTKDGNIAFKLNMSEEIPANTPFMLKNYTAVAENAVINFGPREIVAPTSELSIPAGEGIQFIGSYKTKVIDKDMPNAYFYNGEGAWKHFGTTSEKSWKIAPFNAYMLMPATGGAREYTFTFEELDGGTTAIRSISEDATGTNAKGWYTLNGVKMQNAPTQKGVYIKDGKKVVIK